MNQLLTDLLTHIVDNNCSDLHLVTDFKPYARKSGTIINLTTFEVITKAIMESFVEEILREFPYKKDDLDKKKQVDLSYSLGEQRFRVNVFTQMSKIGIVIRVINSKIPSLFDLGLPPLIDSFSNFHSGLVLVTGPTGSGKSTTLAAIIDKINKTQRKHILTVEDPIEYVHKNKSSIVNQREVGQDVRSFSDAVKSALREDPDIVLVGEMRDLETMSNAVTIAETGHLVFGTLHTMSAAQTVNRIIDVFEPSQQQQIRIQLASALQAVVCQQLVPGIDSKYRCAAEVMICDDAIRGIIREGRNVSGINDNICMRRKEFGTQSLDQSLASLVNKRQVSLEDAKKFAADKESLLRYISSGVV